MTENGGLHNHVVGASESDQIAELIEALSAYIEQYHGGWVRMDSYEGGVLKVKMGQFFPQVKEVQAIPS